MNYGFTVIPAITVICYLIAEVIKNTPLSNRWLPVISGTIGGILGIVGMNVITDFPADDIITAVAVGIVSGLSATGANQIYKQLKQKEVKDGIHT